jgi:acetyl esterase
MSNKMIISVIAACFVFVGSATARIEPDQIIEYKRVGTNLLTLHFFHPPDMQPGDQYPTIVFFFGGGWKTGTPTHFYSQSLYLASRGMIAICADYRTRNKHQTTPAECVKDAKSAMRWIRSHAGELGVDPNRLAAGGGSAGGHLAAATALVKGFNEEGEEVSVSCIPDALVLFNPVIDNGPDGYGYERVKDYWEAFSPLHNITETAPPTLIMLGTGDELVPVITAEKFKIKMEQAGSRCDLRLYEGQPHRFFNKEKYNETLTETAAFLASLGYLNRKGIE